MSACILIWLGVAATQFRPYFDYQFIRGHWTLRAARALFVSVAWPVVVFLVVRKAFLEHVILGLQGA